MELRRAVQTDINGIIDIIKKRIVWMEKMNLHQWNKTGYLEAYPPQYFQEHIQDFHIAVQDNGNIAGCMALYEKDPRWEDDIPAYYIHHLATLPGFKGLGLQMLSYAEALSKSDKKRALRLDSQKGNRQLEKFYESAGFHAVAAITDGCYIGIKREKPIV